MKTLLLLRHAKASAGHLSLPDIDRPLNDLGKTEAKLIGEFLAKQDAGSELVLCSPAVRTRETIAIVAATALLSAEIRIDHRIYEANLDELIEVIGGIELGLDSVMLVGHNPGLEILIERLTGNPASMASGTLAKIRFKTDDWSSTADEQAELEWLVKPNDLRAD